MNIADKILRVVKYKELLKPIQKRCLKGILERANKNRPLCKSQIKMLDESLKTIKCHLTDLACRNTYEKTYHIVYKTTNNKNGRYYVGVHSSNYLIDSYLGSGVELNRDIDFYGRENFSRENLFIYKNRQQAFDKEAEIVDKAFCNRLKTYNISLGGNRKRKSPKKAKFVSGSYKNYRSKSDRRRNFSGFLDSNGNKIYE